MLADKTVVLGVTGGIAAYKVADVASKLTQSGANVRVVMTKSASEFITPLTFRSITHRYVVTDIFDRVSGLNIGHVALAELADAVVNPAGGRLQLPNRERAVLSFLRLFDLGGLRNGWDTIRITDVWNFFRVGIYPLSW